MDKLNEIAAKYGCTIDDKNQIITKSGKESGLFIHVFNMRIKVKDKLNNNKLLFSAPYDQLGRFFELYWGIKPNE